MRVFAIVFMLMALAISGMAIWIDSDPDSGHIGVGAGADGQFSIGVPPNGVFPYVRELLHSSYRHPSPEGAFFSLWVDSSIVYSNNAIIPLMFPDSAAYIDDHNIVPTMLDDINSWLFTEWFIRSDSIRVSQILQPIETGGSGTVVMKWIIHNQSSRSHTLGFMVYLDTKVGVSDTALIVAPGIPASDSSRVLPDPLRGWDVPPYWEAFEGDPTDTADDGLVARSVLSLPPNTTPDRIAFGDIHDLLGTFWDPIITMPKYHDSGVMAWWYPVEAPAGSTIIIQTSYGLADSTASIGGIYGMRLSFPHHLVVRGCELRPNPFGVTIGVTNNSDSTVHNMRVKIDLSTADYCTLVTGEVDDKPVIPASLAEGEMGFTFFDLEIPDPPTITHVDQFMFEAYTTDSFSRSPYFNLWMQGTDYLGPEARTIEPLWGTITSDPNQVIKMFIHDEDSWVDTLRIFFGFITAAGTLYADIAHPELSFRNDTLYFTPPEPLQNARYYWFRLAQAEDGYGCPSLPDSGRFLCDLEGPVLGPNHFPPDSSIQTDSLVRVWINAKDLLGSIRVQSIDWRFRLDGYTTPLNFIGGTPGLGAGVIVSTEIMQPDTVYWNPAGWTSGPARIPDGYVTSTLAGLTDDPDYGIPNPCPGVPFGWAWIMNSHGPRVRPIRPFDGDFVSIPDIGAQFYLYDGNSMIPDSTRIMFDGSLFPFTHSPRDSVHTITPPSAFPNGHVVEIEVVNAYDSLFTPLDMASHTEWSYTIDVSPPVITNGSISHGDTLGVDHIEVSIDIVDSISGVNPESLTVYVNGSPVTASWAGGSVSFLLEVATDSALIRIEVCDNIDVGSANWLRQNIVVYIVMEGPRAHLMGNPDGFICSATGPIKWWLNDPDGIEESTIRMDVNGSTITISDPGLSFNALTSELTYSPTTPWADGAVVTAELTAAEDVFGFELISPVGGVWIVSVNPTILTPTVRGTWFDPLTGRLDDSLIVIDWRWDYAELDSVKLDLSGSIFEEGDPGFVVTDSLITFDSEAAGITLDSAVTYYFVLSAKTICAFSDGEWISDTLEVFSSSIDESKLPTTVKLHANRPDPFNATTTIPFEVAEIGKVRIEISDILGRRVCVLFAGYLAPGYHEKVWDGRDDNGRELPSGVYNCRLITREVVLHQRITLIK